MGEPELAPKAGKAINRLKSMYPLRNVVSEAYLTPDGQPGREPHGLVDAQLVGGDILLKAMDVEVVYGELRHHRRLDGAGGGVSGPRGGGGFPPTCADMPEPRLYEADDGGRADGCRRTPPRGHGPADPARRGRNGLRRPVKWFQAWGGTSTVRSGCSSCPISG